MSPPFCGCPFFFLDVFTQPLYPCFGRFGVFMSFVLGQLHVSWVLLSFLFTFDVHLNVSQAVYVANL